MESRRPDESRVISTVLMLPEDANPRGNVHGGVIMKLVDEVGAMAAMRHARRNVVTIAIDSMKFLSPVHVGDMVTFSARVDYVGRTSMEVSVRVDAEKPVTGAKTHTNSAFLVFVALDEEGKPVPVPGLTLDTDESRQAFEAGRQRQKDRLARDGKNG
jgi:uncharacterized protein (TIGR00369 family)